MSANVNFVVPGPGSAAGRREAGAPAAAPVIILPYDILTDLQGRRVTVLLATGGEELEGTLRTVDADRGDLFLEDVVHYAWVSTSAAAAAAAAGGSTAPTAEEGAGGGAGLGMRPCGMGGGARKVLRRCDAAVVNSRFVDLITPTLFGEGGDAGAEPTRAKP